MFRYFPVATGEHNPMGKQQTHPKPFTPSPCLRSARARDPFLVLKCHSHTHSGPGTAASTHGGQGHDYLPGRRKVPEPASPGSLWGLDFLLPPAVNWELSIHPLGDPQGPRQELRIFPMHKQRRHPRAAEGVGGGLVGWHCDCWHKNSATYRSTHASAFYHHRLLLPPPCPVLSSSSLPTRFLLGSTVLDHWHGNTLPTRTADTHTRPLTPTYLANTRTHTDFTIHHPALSPSSAEYELSRAFVLRCDGSKSSDDPGQLDEYPVSQLVDYILLSTLRFISFLLFAEGRGHVRETG